MSTILFECDVTEFNTKPPKANDGNTFALMDEAVIISFMQTKPEKILFVDDGVGDCKHLPSLYPEVEYIFRETNLGTVANFQDMLERVQTEKVLFLGADNWLRSDTIEILNKTEEDIGYLLKEIQP